MLLIDITQHKSLSRKYLLNLHMEQRQESVRCWRKFHYLLIRNINFTLLYIISVETNIKHVGLQEKKKNVAKMKKNCF